jgi:hypothetical protein
MIRTNRHVLSVFLPDLMNSRTSSTEANTMSLLRELQG